MRHISHLPLIGGFSIACLNILGVPPEIITSYSPFEANDTLLLRYLKNKHLNIPYYQLDKLNNYNNLNVYKNIDIATSIPPCSGLSMCSSFKSGIRATAPANDWMYKSAQFILETFSPKIYVFENGPNLFSDSGKLVRELLIEIAKKHDYAITFYKTNSIYHGIPQNRPRTYTIFVPGKNAPILEFFNKPLPSITEFLSLIPSNASLQDKYALKEPYINDFEIVKFLKKKFGLNWRQEFLKDKHHLTSYDFLYGRKLLEEFLEFAESFPDKNYLLIKDIKHVINKKSQGKNFRISYRVLCIDKDYIYAVIGEMMERNIHPIEDRRYNMREYLTFMKMPFDFEIENKEDYKKITQNCPVATNEDIIRECIDIIKGNRKFSNEQVYMQDNTKKDIKEKKTKALF